MKYKITRTEKDDSRTMEKGEAPDRDELLRSVDTHIHDVQNLFYYFMRKEVYPDVKSHDHTKVDDFEGFIDNIKVKTVHDKPFYGHTWWKKHIREEPHHAFLYTGDKQLHLGHAIHMLCDWVSAGKARSKDGKFNLKLQANNAKDKEEVKRLLYKWFQNTLSWLDENSEVNTQV